MTRRFGFASIAIALLSASSLAAILWIAIGGVPDAWVRWWNPDSRPELRRLAAALADRRITPGRLTGGLPWSPIVEPTRGEAAPASALGVEAWSAIREIERALARSRSPRNLAALATSRLAAGDPEAAVGALEEALAQEERAAYWADLSAAYLARAVAPARSADLPRALEASSRAIHLARTQPESWFNNALALERLHLPTRARVAWEQYLALDPSSPWAGEARTHVERLKATTTSAGAVGVDMQPLREQLFDDVLPRWAAARLARRPVDAAAASKDARALLEKLAPATSDRYAHDVVAALSDALERTPTPTEARLAEGLVAYGAGRRAYRRDDYEASAPYFSTARTVLESGGHPLAIAAAIHEALVAYRSRDFASAGRTLSRVRASIADRPYPSQLGRIAWTEGLIANVTGRVAAGVVQYRTALQRLREAEEHANAAFVLGLLATSYDVLGDPTRSWQARVESLRGTAREGVALRAAIEAMRSQWPRAALEFAEASAERARAANRGATVADALRFQAVIHAALGEPERARERLAGARAIIGQNSGATWDRLEAEVDVAEALAAQGDGRAAGIDAAQRALRYFQSTTPPSEERLPEIHLARARLARAGGDPHGALADLDAGIAILRRLRDHVTPGTEQATFADIVRRLVNEHVDLSAEIGDVDRAFIQAERARAWDLGEVDDDRALSLPAISRALTRGTVLVDFVVADRRSFAWIVTPTAARFVTIDAGRLALERLIRAAMPPRLDAQAARRLRDLLLSSAAAELASSQALVIVPDGPLHLLSFAILPGVRARYLIEEHALGYSPGAAFLTTPRVDAPPVDAAVLAVGNPRLDFAALGTLSTLRFAEEEATTVAGKYAASTSLLRDAATRTAFVARMPTADVVHFAGHAVVNHLNPAESSLLLAGSPADPLTAREIRTLQLPRARLVVLSACDTAAGFMTQSQGPLSLSRAFLSAGARTVVASVWPVDDFASLQLLSRFHDAYKKTGRADDALREAQLVLSSSSNPQLNDPGRWGAFTVMGRGARGEMPSPRSDNHDD